MRENQKAYHGIVTTPTETNVPIHVLGDSQINPRWEGGIKHVIVPKGGRCLIPIGWPDEEAYYIHPDGSVERVRFTVEFPEHPEGEQDGQEGIRP